MSDNSPAASSAPRSRPRRSLKWLAWAVGLYAAAGFLLAPYLLRNLLLDFIHEDLQRDGTVIEVKINPFDLSLNVWGFRIDETDGTPLLAFNELNIDFSLASLLNRAWTFEEFRLVRPYVNTVIRTDGTVNLTGLGDNLNKETETDPAPASGAGIPRLIFRNILIADGRLDYQDLTHPARYAASLKPLNLKLDDFSTLPDREGRYGFSATLGDGGRLRWSGNVALVPPRSSGTLEISGVKVATLWRYFQHRVNFIADEGALAMRGDYALAMGPGDSTVAIDDARLELAGLTVRKPGEAGPLLTLPLLQVEGIAIRWPEQKARIDTIRLTDTAVRAVLDAQGELDWQRLVKTADTATDTPPPAQGKEDTAPVPWRVTIGDFLLRNFTAGLADRSALPRADVTLDALDLRLSHIDSASGSQFELDLKTRVNKGGEVRVTGQVGALPPASALQIQARGVPLKPFQPYVARAARLKLRSGELHLDGQLAYGEDGAAPDLRFTGRAGIDRFDSRDTLTGQRFLAWKALRLDGLDLALSPDHLDIDTIDSEGLYARIVIAEDGSLNISHVLQSDSGEEKQDPPVESPPSGKPLPVKIGRVRLKGASAHFADLSLKPRFATAIHSLDGEIAGLSSAAPARADVYIDGKVDNHGTVAIRGRINPLSEDKYTDLDVRFGNIELTTFTPYSGKFAGYVIDKGKLDLALNYQVSQQKLVGKNRIVLNQLTLGEHTDSPDAVSLPIKLAIALMKDANGRIDINLPVEGDLDDPEFRYGHLIGKALLKLITGIVTSPFKFLGSLLGVDGGELEYAQFEPGSDRLPQDEREKALKVAEALKMRPQLDLEIRGAHDPARDGLALKTGKLEKRILLRLGDSTAVNTSPQEAQEQMLGILETLYEEQFGATQRAQLEAGFTLPAQEAPGKKKPWGRKPAQPRIDQAAYLAALRNRLIDVQPLAAGELRLLAQARAMAVMDILVAEGGIEGTRIYILEPQTDGGRAGEMKAHLSLTAK